MSAQTPLPNQDALLAAKNLKAWQDEIARLDELSSLQAAMLARNIVQASDAAGTDPAVLRGVLATLFDTSAKGTQEHLSARIAFCRAWQKNSKKGDDARREAQPDAVLTVALLDSPLFADADKAFAALLPHTEALPCTSFGDVLEAVGSGSAQYGILPIENARDGKLFRFYEQIEGHELQIYATRSVTLAGGESDTRIALITKAPPALPSGKPRIIECVVFEENPYSLSELLSVAATLDIRLRRIDSLPASFGGGHFRHHPVLFSQSGEDDLFFTYLDLFMPRTIVTAHYVELKG